MIKNNTNRQALSSSYLQNMERTRKTEIAKRSECKDMENKIQDRVSQIQEQIERGEYRVDLKKTSEKMALNLLNL